MKCREAEGQFADFLSEKAPKELRRRIKVHLKSCKKCQDRLNRLKKKETVPAVQEAGDLQKASALSSALSAAPESHAAPAEPAPFSKHPSSLRLMPALTAAMAVLIVGGLYFFTQGATDAGNSLIDQTPLLSDGRFPSPSIEVGSNQNSTFTAETPAVPSVAAERGAEAPLIPKKVGNGKPHDLSKEAPKGPPVKVLLISRDLKEATKEILLRTTQSDGKVLDKKEGDLAAKFVLLIPAPQYDAFFGSLQQLGLAKETFKESPPAEGSLKLELTVE